MSATGATPTLATSAGAANLATALPSVDDIDRIANTPAPPPAPSPSQSHAATAAPNAATAAASAGAGDDRKDAVRKIPKKTTTVIVRKPAAAATSPAKQPTAVAAATAPSQSSSPRPTSAAAPQAGAAPRAGAAAAASLSQASAASEKKEQARDEDDDDDDEDDKRPLNIGAAKRDRDRDGEERKQEPKRPAAAAAPSGSSRTPLQQPRQGATAAEHRMRDVGEAEDHDEEDGADDEEEWTGGGSTGTGPQQPQPMAVDEAKHSAHPVVRRREESKQPAQNDDDEADQPGEEDGDAEEQAAADEAEAEAEEEPEEDLEPPPSSDEEEDLEPPASSAEEEQDEAEDEYEDSPAKRKKRARSTSPAKKKSGGRAAKPKGKAARGKRKKGNNDDDDFVDDDEDDEDRGSEDDEKDDDEDNTKSELFPTSNYTQRSEVLPLVETHGANKWNRESHKGKQKWETLEHNGVLFPPAYAPHHVPLLYDGEELTLSDDAEEVATMYAAMVELSEFVGNPTFNSNFFKDWRGAMSKAERQKIQKLDKCDFTRIHKHVMQERDKKKAAKKENPALAKREKEEKDRVQEVYGYALVDGYKEKVGNFRVEPPGLFRGRGKHPKTGRLKLRVKPEDIIINIGVGVPIPPCPPGHKWKGIMHNNRVTWLAFWHDNVNDGFKYVWLAASSKFKGLSDINKYTKAQRLKGCIADIRHSYYGEMRSKEYVRRQRATAIYLIDVLALRVGNEKDKSEVADTVGCCSLRCEHITFEPDFTVTLNFLGKDSMQYLNTVKVDSRVYANLQEFTRRKKATDDVFDSLSTATLNEHLKSLMDGLTAKVFRTYNASHTLQLELTDNADNDVPIDELVSKKVAVYTKANRVVAVLCNHQRSVPKGHEGQMKKMVDRLEEVRDEKEELEDRMEEVAQQQKGAKGGRHKGEAERRERKKGRDERRAARRQRRREEAMEKARKDKKEYASDDDGGADDKPRSLPADLGKLEERLERVDKRLADMTNNLQAKDESKTVALGTSKINYMDPRITVAWCKEKEVPIEKIFNKSLLAKFPWAMEVPSSWRF